MSTKFSESKLYSIAEIQSFFKNNIISPSSYIKQLIMKTMRYNETLKVYISFNELNLMNRMKTIDAIVENDILDNKVLSGIPFNIKDSFITKHYKTTYGVKDGPIDTSKNSRIVNLFEKQGGILLGKTSIPAYAYDVQTFNDLIGVTPNPWNNDYSSGGSTGGGSVSVSTGLIPLAIGSDFAGSIRIPASFCGVKGYIPTSANKFLAGHYPDFLGDENFLFQVGQVGFLSNFLSDFSQIYEILSNKRSTKIKFDCKSHSYTICMQDEFVPINSDIKTGLKQIIQVLQKEKVEMNFDYPKEFSFKEVGRVHTELMNRTFDSRSEPEKLDSKLLEEKKNYFARNLDDFLENRFWILPISSTPAIKHNLDHKAIVVDSKPIPYWRAMIHYCRPFNIVDNPIIAIPVGKNGSGLPISIQIVGPKGSDLHLIALAQFLELKIGSLDPPPNFDFN